jgi:hypothetical protein
MPCTERKISKNAGQYVLLIQCGEDHKMPVFRPNILHEALQLTSEPSGPSELAMPVHGSLWSYLDEDLLKAGNTNPCAYLQQQDNNMAVEWRTRATSGSSQFRFATPVPTLGPGLSGKISRKRILELWCDFDKQGRKSPHRNKNLCLSVLVRSS